MERWTTELEALPDAKDIDTVIVAMPNAYRAQAVVAAAARRKPDGPFAVPEYR